MLAMIVSHFKVRMLPANDTELLGLASPEDSVTLYAAMFLKPFHRLLSMRFIMALIWAPGPSSCSSVLPLLTSAFKIVSHFTGSTSCRPSMPGIADPSGYS